MYQPEHEVVYELMKGAYDLHMHPSPDVVERSLNDYEAMQMADQYGMNGILIKNHLDPTPARAALLNASHQFKVKAYSGAVLNHSIGGLNPDAVKLYLDMGADVIWMPTLHAENHIAFYGKGNYCHDNGIRILDEKGELKPEVYDIMDLVKAYDAVLATGHLSLEESLVLCKEASKRNIKMVLTHSEWTATFMPLDMQKELLHTGVIFEKLWYDVGLNQVTAAYMADTMKELGFENCFLSTDRGQPGKEYPVEGLMMFMDALLDNGIHEKDIRTMSHQVPEYLMKR